MIILGVGIGIAMNPLLLAAMSDVKPEESGLASGVVNTSFMMGGALGLAVLASVAAARTGGEHVARPRSPTATTPRSSSEPCSRPPRAPSRAVFMRDVQMRGRGRDAEEALRAA